MSCGALRALIMGGHRTAREAMRQLCHEKRAWVAPIPAACLSGGGRDASYRVIVDGPQRGKCCKPRGLGPGVRHLPRRRRRRPRHPMPPEGGDGFASGTAARPAPLPSPPFPTADRPPKQRRKNARPPEQGDPRNAPAPWGEPGEPYVLATAGGTGRTRNPTAAAVAIAARLVRSAKPTRAIGGRLASGHKPLQSPTIVYHAQLRLRSASPPRRPYAMIDALPVSSE
jgi:hypothetical protein